MDLRKTEIRIKRLLLRGETREANRLISKRDRLINSSELVETPVVEKVKTIIKVEKAAEISTVVKTSKKKGKFLEIKDLSKIKGIGRETTNDIGNIYDSIEELIKALKSNKSLPLRNDIELKLKNELI